MSNEQNEREALLAVIDYIERGLIVNNHGGRDFDFVGQLESQARAALASKQVPEAKSIAERITRKIESMSPEHLAAFMQARERLHAWASAAPEQPQANGFGPKLMPQVSGFDQQPQAGQSAEPVAWVRRHPDGALTAEFLEHAVIEPVRKRSGAWVPLYAAQPPAPPALVPLTVPEIHALWKRSDARADWSPIEDFARAIEARYGIGTAKPAQPEGGA